MAVQLPNGTLLAIGSAVAAAQAITVATNANPCVVTIVGHGYSNGDLVIVSSGWARANGKVFRVAGSTTDTFQLENLDTSNTAVFPAGSGLGTAQKVSTFTQISQILDPTSTGGEQKFLTYQFLESDSEVDIPTVKSGGGITFAVGDDPSLAGYVALEAANDDRVPRALSASLSNGAKIYYYGYVSINKTPSLTVNELMKVTATIKFINEPVRYAA